MKIFIKSDNSNLIFFRIKLQITSFCDSNWYDSGCNTNCVSQDSCDGHYTCNTLNGGKICNKGWTGAQCDVPDSSLVPCSDSDC